LAKRLDRIDPGELVNFRIAAQRKASQSDVILNRWHFVEAILQPHQLTKSLCMLFVVKFRHEVVNMRNAMQGTERLFLVEIFWL
jgi:hypothetical protein